ncbi:MAG: hypothetical protein LAT76_08425 [Schleiferiaceae bacterium]|nr:hypothetical protein [Schleiferiaceae bacterium]
MEKCKLIELLEAAEQSEIIINCIIDLQSDDYLLMVYEQVFNKNQQFLVLSRRMNSSNKNSLLGVEKLLARLKDYTNNAVRILKIATEEHMFSIYLTEDNETVIGVLLNKNKGKDESLLLEKEYLKRGFKNLTLWKK